ncbi:MAG: bifunctional demethylmenaquinone methyltransferase/2-methoxy-6-polyprenyl-1,4-benzoquinol methylase UbiE [Flammeovirgaceae bacterium]
MTVVPYKDHQGSKKEQVAEMFDNISKKYDFLNRFLSVGIDIFWRKQAIKQLKYEQPQYILDVATGTADLAIEAIYLNPRKIIGIDISEGMLEIGRKKIEKKGLTQLIELQKGDSENLPFKESTFDAVMVSFGVRNFENLEKGLTNIHKVLKKDGTLLVLEFSKPNLFPIKQIYQFYFKFILPFIGKIISKDQSAYTYLPASVQQFPDGRAFTEILEKIGFTQTKCILLTFGICSIYLGKK